MLSALHSRHLNFVICLLLMGSLSLFKSTGLACPEKSSVATSSEVQQLRPFTVADSIESTHFVQPFEHSGQHPPVSPDGKRFLVVTERGLLNANLREFSLLIFDSAHLQSPPKRVAVFRTSSNRPGIARAKWVGNDTVSLIGENPGDLPQLYLVNCATHRTRKLTAAALGIFDYDLAKDLRTVVYYEFWGGNHAGNKQKEEHGFAVTDESLFDLVTGLWKKPPYVVQMFILRPGSGKARLVKATPVVESTRLKLWLSPDGRYVVACEGPLQVPEQWLSYDDPLLRNKAAAERGRVHSVRPFGMDQYMLIDTQTLVERPLLNAPLSGAPAVAWMSDSHSVVVSGTLLPLDTNDPEELAIRRKNAAVAEVRVPTLSYRRVVDIPGQQAWGELTPGSSPETFLVEGTKGDAIRPFCAQYRRLGQQWIQDQSCVAKDYGAQIVLSEANDRWPKLVKIDPATQNETVILDPNPQFKKLRFGREEIVHWTGNLGESHVGGLLYPPNYTAGKKYPLVVQTYVLIENGFLLDGPATTAYAAQALANREVFVLQLAHGPFWNKSYQPGYGHRELSQIDSAVAYLDNLGLIDSKRIGLIGFSAKGYQVVYALAHSKYRFAAATSAEGSDWGYWTYLSDANNPGWALQSENQYGGPPWKGNWKNWMDEAITFHFDKIHTPLRLESDTNDTGGAINEWEKFIALKRLHKPVELICLSHGDHPVVKPWDRMTSQQGNVDWLMFWLKGEEDPDPAKAAQYARWRELQKLQEQDEANTESQSGN